MPQLIYKEPAFFNTLAQDIHNEENRKWWYDENGVAINNPDHRLKLLIVSEIIEAMEGDRKNLMDDKVETMPMVAVELADAVIRLLDRMEGKRLTRFRHVYRFREVEDKTDITKHLYEIVALVSSGHSEVIGTEFVVYKILDTALSFGYDIFGAITEKRKYNKYRGDHSYEERSKYNGKKY